MRRSSEPEERAQFTVAELLARYGEPAPTPGRRRRRAAEEPDAPAETPVPPVAHPNKPGRRQSTIPPSAPLRTPDGPSTQPNLNGRNGRSWAPAVGPPPGPGQRPPVAPPVVARRAPLGGTAVSGGPITDQLPRYNPASTQPPTSASRRPTSAQPVNAPPISTQPVKIPPVSIPPAGAPTVSAPVVTAQAPAGLGTAVRDIPEQHKTATVEVDTDDAEESGSPLWEWAAMVSQVGLGVVGGATFWLICEWLWQRIPVVALVVALGLITGMVWVVRRVRRAEDLQTTVIAVLVGLFVTVSPAALLLVGR
ncbi:MAG TPA: hypothetical protein VJS67_02645 [Pseudonocardiaceae bacterium]|nr:hypothetical protein [Pseudonocardiaceae bacterium]